MELFKTGQNTSCFDSKNMIQFYDKAQQREVGLWLYVQSEKGKKFLQNNPDRIKK